jgi:hypothetical protein
MIIVLRVLRQSGASYLSHNVMSMKETDQMRALRGHRETAVESQLT